MVIISIEFFLSVFAYAIMQAHETARFNGTSLKLECYSFKHVEAVLPRFTGFWVIISRLEASWVTLTRFFLD